jgi:transposase
MPTDVRQLVDPAFFSRLENLELRAKGIVEGFMHGLHRSPFVGFSVEFASHREYAQGDDLRHVNWKLFARQRRLYVKQFDAETNMNLYLLLDISGSMDCRSKGISKREYGAALAAALAHLALKSLSDYRTNRLQASVMKVEEVRSRPTWRCQMAGQSSSRFHQIPDTLWERIDLLLPIYKASPKGGRPRLPMRNVVGGILYVLATGCQWKAMPKQFGSGSAIHAYFQEWVKLGVFAKLWKLALTEYDDLKGIDWKWQSLDGAMTKSPLGGEKNREKPDRSRQVGRQAIGARRRAWRAAGGRRGWRQCA